MLSRIHSSAAALFLCLGASAGMAAELPPHLSDRGRNDYARFSAMELHRAFVIAPGGTWSWRADAASPEAALEAALADCRKRTRQTCVPYAVDDRVVFDVQAWHRLWGPYGTAAQAAAAATGVRPGNRFVDLEFRDRDGRALSLSSLRGKVVVLHFWGSWCRPCRHELPDLERLQTSLRERKDVAFVLLQVREGFAQSRRWAKEQGVRLPLYDSGVEGESDETLRVAGGSGIRDRELARAFPTTYVLDKHGLVLFSHIGPVPRWSEYAPFLRDAAERSGR